MQPFLQPFVDRFGLLPAGAVAAGLVFARYLLLAGGVYLVFYVWWSRAISHRKIQSKAPKSKQVLAEVRHSLYTAMVFGGMATALYVARQHGYTRHYLHIADHGRAYFGLTVVGIIVVHDAYFYWIHRLMHHPRLFKSVHRIHHQSINPTPLAALSFHPLEALLEFGIVPVIVFLIPIHPAVLLIFSLWSMVWNITGHLGYELFPARFTRHWLGQWFNTATHHNMHHQYSRDNYGLYFNWWDRWMDTNHPNYLDVFDQVKRRQIERDHLSG